jgi:hypothetical protein
MADKTDEVIAFWARWLSKHQPDAGAHFYQLGVVEIKAHPEYWYSHAMSGLFAAICDERELELRG